MKWSLLCIAFICTTLLSAFQVTDEKGTVTEIRLEQIQQAPQQTINTTRVKKDKTLQDSWQGPYLTALLGSALQGSFTQIRFDSADHYQVRLSKEDLLQQNPILAWKQNGTTLSEKEVRLVLPDKRDMFWISGIEQVTLESKAALPQPTTISVFEYLQPSLQLEKEIFPFKNMVGYSFSKVAEAIFSVPDGDILVVGRDGVSHLLDYRTYLLQAVLERTSVGHYTLKSPAMPAGMWVKDIAYIQLDKQGLVFASAFENDTTHALIKLLQWSIPDDTTWTVQSKKKQCTIPADSIPLAPAKAKHYEVIQCGS